MKFAKFSLSLKGEISCIIHKERNKNGQVNQEKSLPQIQIGHLMFSVVYAPIMPARCSVNLHLTYRRNQLFFWS